MDTIDNIHTVDLRHFEYDKVRKVLRLPRNHMGMPSMFYIRSHHTGNYVKFRVIDEMDPLFDQDQWDGEQQIYRPVEQLAAPNVDYVVIYNTY